VASESVVTLGFESDRVHAWAAAPPRGEGVIELGAGSIVLFGGIADPTPLAFTARLPGGGGGEVALQGNINRGLMILATYVRARAESALAGRFSREFHARRTPELVPPSSPRVAAVPVEVPASFDGREFVGRWINASEAGELRSVEIAGDGSKLSLRVRGTGRRSPEVWPEGEAAVFGYFDELGRDTLLLLGHFELPEGQTELQIKVVIGTAVVACFHSRSGGASWFTREFLRRESGIIAVADA
jgi:hypothetical protein